MFALVFLVVGFPPILGWLIGVVLLVSSPLWSTRQKLLGILVWPGGLTTVVAVAAGLVMAVPSPVNYVLMTVLVLAPLVVAVYLYQAARRQSDAV